MRVRVRSCKSDVSVCRVAISGDMITECFSEVDFDISNRPHMLFLKPEQRGTFLVLLGEGTVATCPTSPFKVNRTQALP